MRLELASSNAPSGTTTMIRGGAQCHPHWSLYEVAGPPAAQYGRDVILCPVNIQQDQSCLTLGLKPAVGFEPPQAPPRSAAANRLSATGTTLHNLASDYPGVPIVTLPEVMTHLSAGRQQPPRKFAAAPGLMKDDEIRQLKKQNKQSTSPGRAAAAAAQSELVYSKMLAPKDNPESKPRLPRTVTTNVGLPQVALLVAYFPRAASAADLRRVFEAFGQVAQAYVVRGKDGASKCYGFICFIHTDVASIAHDACQAGQVIMNDAKGKAWHIKASWANNAAPLQRTRQAQKMSKKGLLIEIDGVDTLMPESELYLGGAPDSEGTTDAGAGSTISSSSTTSSPEEVDVN